MYGWKTILSFWEGLVFKGELLVSGSVHLQLAHRRPHQLEVLVLKLVFSVWCDGMGPQVFGQIEKVGATGIVICYDMGFIRNMEDDLGNPRTVTLPRKVPTFSL